MQRIQDTLTTNLQVLMKGMKINKPQLAKKSGISPRMISYILSGDRIPTVETIESLAHAFGLRGWQLLIPNLQPDLVKAGKLDSLIKNYSGASDKGREYIDRVAEEEAKYTTSKRVA